MICVCLLILIQSICINRNYLFSLLTLAYRWCTKENWTHAHIDIYPYKKTKSEIVVNHQWKIRAIRAKKSESEKSILINKQKGIKIAKTWVASRISYFAVIWFNLLLVRQRKYFPLLKLTINTFLCSPILYSRYHWSIICKFSHCLYQWSNYSSVRNIWRTAVI